MKKILSFLSVLFLTIGGTVPTIACSSTKSNVNPKPPTPGVLPYNNYVTSNIESITNNDAVTKLNILNEDTGTISYNITFNSSLSGQQLKDAKNNKFWSGSYTIGVETMNYNSCTVNSISNQKFVVTFTYDTYPDYPLPINYKFDYITFLGGTTFDIFSASNKKCLQVPKVESVSFIDHSSSKSWNLVIEFSVVPSQKALDIIMSKFTWQLGESNPVSPSPIVVYDKMVSTGTDNVFELQSPSYTVPPIGPFSLEYTYIYAGIVQRVALTS